MQSFLSWVKMFLQMLYRGSVQTFKYFFERVEHYIQRFF